MRKYENMDMKPPFCPYCSDGVIVWLEDHNVFICNRCGREVKIEKVKSLWRQNTTRLLKA